MPAAVTFGGNEIFSAPPEQVFAALTDLDRLPRLIPELVSAEKIDDRTLNCVVRPGFSFLRGTLRMTITIIDMNAPKTASMKVSAAGIGADRSRQHTGNHTDRFGQHIDLVSERNRAEGPGRYDQPSAHRRRR